MPIKPIHKFADVSEFSAEQLPDELRAYTRELAARYTVPQSDLVLACIATAGTAVGFRAKAYLGWGAQATPSNLLAVFKSEPSTNLRVAIEHIVVPIHNRQTELLRQHGQVDEAKLKKDLKIARGRVAAARLGDPETSQDLAAYTKLQQLALPALLVEGLDRNTLLQTLSESADGTMFFSGEFTANGKPCLLEEERSLDMDLVERCLGRAPVMESFGRIKVKVPEPSLGGVVVAAPDGFESWFNNCDASPVIGASLLLLRSPAMPAEIYKSALTEVRLQDAWHQRIEGLMDHWNPEALPLHVCPPALECLFGYHNDILSQTARLPPDARSVCCAPFTGDAADDRIASTIACCII